MCVRVYFWGEGAVTGTGREKDLNNEWKSFGQKRASSPMDPAHFFKRLFRGVDFLWPAWRPEDILLPLLILCGLVWSFIVPP